MDSVDERSLEHCGNCHWYRRHDRYEGQCRRHAPGANHFPRMKTHDRCGDFKPGGDFMSEKDIQIERLEADLRFYKVKYEGLMFAVEFTEWARSIWRPT